MIDWCLDLNIEDTWELLLIWRVYITGKNRDLENSSSHNPLRIKDDIVVYTIGNIAKKKIDRGGTSWERNEDTF